MVKLNYGCNQFKYQDFINIDIDPNNNPDIVMDLRDIDSRFSENSVDFVYAGHFFEHVPFEVGIDIMKRTKKVLRPNCCIVVVIPDYRKTAEMEGIVDAERIILNYGNHVSLYDENRLEKLGKESGFILHTKLELDRIPWIILPAGINPTPEKWQSAHLYMKT